MNKARSSDCSSADRVLSDLTLCFSRRELLLLSFLGLLPLPSEGQSVANPIVQENQIPGDSGWLTQVPALNREIEGYASQVSALPGDTVNLYVSTRADHCSLSVYRLGWYQGAGARQVAHYDNLTGGRQPDPTPDPTTGFVECNWHSGFALTIPGDWVTGLYLLRLEEDPAAVPSPTQSYIPLVIRAANSHSDLLFQSCNTTAQAYNAWGGESLYVSATGGSQRSHAYTVSFDRPYGRAYDMGAIGGGNLYWEYPTLRWLERQGYDLSYTTNHDTHSNPAELLNHKIFLSVGHDEYWTRQMRDGVEAARDRGIHLLFLSSNICYWQIRFDSSPLGVNRRMICYKNDGIAKDPLYGVDNSRVTTLWRSSTVDRPENGLVGGQYTASVGPLAGRGRDYMPVHFTLGNSPQFADVVSLLAAEDPPAVIGYEYDVHFENGAEPPGLEVLAASPVISNYDGRLDLARITRYLAPSGSQVLASGTFALGWGLDPLFERESPAVKQFVTDVLAGMLSGVSPNTGTPLQRVTQVVPKQIYLQPGWTTTLIAIVGGQHAAANWSVTQGAGFATVSGNGTPYGFVSISITAPDGAEVHIQAQSAAFPDSVAVAVLYIQKPKVWQARFFAGSTSQGYLDGIGTQAQFLFPATLLPDSQGNLYVADIGNHAIRKVDPNGNVSTFYRGAPLRMPIGLAWSGSSLIVADEANDALYALDANGNLSSFAGTGQYGFADGPAATAQFSIPTGLAADPAGNLYVADTGNHAIRKIDPGGQVTTVAGMGKPGLIDGPAGQSRLYYPYGLAWSAQGLVIADTGNHAIRLLRQDGTLVTLAGTGAAGMQDGAAQGAAFRLPVGVLALSDGEIWIADRGNQVIRSLNTLTGQVTTVIGTGYASSREGGDRTVGLYLPTAVSFGPQGNLYLADQLRLFTVLDTIAPQTTATLTGKQGNNGWYRGSVQVSLTATDAGGGVAASYYTLDGGSQQTYALPVKVSGDGLHTLNFWSVDKAGNTETAKSQALRIDATAPNLVWGSPTPAPNANGWNNSAVDIPYTATDNLSGVASAAPASPLHITRNGAAQKQKVVVTDGAGNQATFTSPAVNIDTTPPAVTVFARPTSIRASGFPVAVTVYGRITDDVSGINPRQGTYSVTDSYGTAMPGGSFSIRADHTYSFVLLLQASAQSGRRTYTIGVHATDQAGNTGSAAAVVTVSN
jgi:hypothetical protein